MEIRSDYMEAARSFLSNPAVQGSPDTSKKVEFLRGKGANDAEIATVFGEFDVECPPEIAEALAKPMVEEGGTTYRESQPTYRGGEVGEAKGVCVDEGEDSAAEVDEAAKLKAELEALKVENDRLKVEADQESGAPPPAAPTPPASVALNLDVVKPQEALNAATQREEVTLAMLKEKEEKLQALRQALRASPELLDEINLHEQEIIMLNAAYMRPVEMSIVALTAANTGEDAAAALKAVAEITKGADNPNSIKYREEYRERDALKTILESLGGFIANKEVAENGCNAICHLTRCEKNHAVLVDIGAGNCISDAMNKHPTDYTVQVAGARAIINLSFACKVNPPNFKGFGDSLHNGMLQFKNERALQLWATIGLKNLAMNDKEIKKYPIWGEAVSETLGGSLVKTRWAQDRELQKWMKMVLTKLEEAKALAA